MNKYRVTIVECIGYKQFVCEVIAESDASAIEQAKSEFVWNFRCTPLIFAPYYAAGFLLDHHFLVPTKMIPGHLGAAAPAQSDGTPYKTRRPG